MGNNVLRAWGLYLAAVLFLLSLPAQAQETPVKAKLLINGHFFTEKPEKMPEGSSLSVLKDSIGGSIVMVTYPKGQALSDFALRKAIPVEQVFRGQEFLRLARSSQQAFGILKAEDSEALVQEGTPFPAFSIRENTGRVWTNDDLRGRVAVFNFWYTGCGPCIKEMPELNTWTEACPEALFFAVTWNSADEIKAIVERTGFRFHQIVGEEALVKAIGVKQTPVTLIVDRESIVRKVEVGTSEKQRADLLAALKQIAKQ